MQAKKKRYGENLLVQVCINVNGNKINIKYKKKKNMYTIIKLIITCIQYIVSKHNNFTSYIKKKTMTNIKLNYECIVRN